MFPKEVIRVDIKPINFNEKQVNEIFVDLKRVNINKEIRLERAILEIQDVLKFVFLLNEINLESEMMRGNYIYFNKILKDEFDKPYRMIFCQDHSHKWIGIISLYRIITNDEN